MSQSVRTGFASRLHSMTRANDLRGQLIRGGMGSAGIQVLSRVLALAMGVVLARALGAEGYGVYAYAFAIMSLLSVAAETGVPTLLMREVAASLGREEWGFLRGALIRSQQFVFVVSTLVTVIGLAVLWTMADHLSAAMLYTNSLMLVVLPLSALGRTVANAIYGLHRVVVGQAIVIVLRPALVLLTVTGVFFVFPYLREPQLAMAAQLVAALIVLLVGVRVLSHVLPPQTHNVPAQYRTHAWLKSAAPFVLIGGADLINNQTDIIMLGWFTSPDNVGIYRVAVQGAILVALSMRIVGAIASPHFARLYARGEMERLQKIVTYGARAALLVALPIAVVFIIAGDTIAGWIFGAEFMASHVPLAILAAGQLAGVALGPVGFLLNMTGYERITARTLWQTAVLNIVLNAILIPLWGIAGAAVATAISFVVLNLILLTQVRRHLKLMPSPFTTISD